MYQSSKGTKDSQLKYQFKCYFHNCRTRTGTPHQIGKVNALTERQVGWERNTVRGGDSICPGRTGMNGRENLHTLELSQMRAMVTNGQ